MKYFHQENEDTARKILWGTLKTFFYRETLKAMRSEGVFFASFFFGASVKVPRVRGKVLTFRRVK